MMKNYFIIFVMALVCFPLVIGADFNDAGALVLTYDTNEADQTQLLSAYLNLVTTYTSLFNSTGAVNIYTTINNTLYSVVNNTLYTTLNNSYYNTINNTIYQNESFYFTINNTIHHYQITNNTIYQITNQTLNNSFFNTINNTIYTTLNNSYFNTINNTIYTTINNTNIDYTNIALSNESVSWGSNTINAGFNSYFGNSSTNMIIYDKYISGAILNGTLPTIKFNSPNFPYTNIGAIEDTLYIIETTQSPSLIFSSADFGDSLNMGSISYSPLDSSIYFQNPITTDFLNINVNDVSAFAVNSNVITGFDNITSPLFITPNGTSDDWNALIGMTGTGGNPFNQSLNTTDFIKGSGFTATVKNFGSDEGKFISTYYDKYDYGYGGFYGINSYNTTISPDRFTVESKYYDSEADSLQYAKSQFDSNGFLLQGDVCSNNCTTHDFNAVLYLYPYAIGMYNQSLFDPEFTATELFYMDASGFRYKNDNVCTENNGYCSGGVGVSDTNDTIKVNALMNENITIWGAINGKVSYNESAKVNALWGENTTIWNTLNYKAGIVSCPLGYHLQNTTQSGGDCKLDTPISTKFNASTISVHVGTPSASSVLSKITSYDEKTYNITEIAGGSGGYDIRINFSGVSSVDNILMREKYSGSSGHEIQVQLWDYGTSSWEGYTDITDQSGFSVSVINVFDPLAHISGGVVQMRLYHAPSGIGSHVFYIDYIALNKGTSLLTSASHDGLDGRDNIITNHPNQNINNTLQQGQINALLGENTTIYNSLNNKAPINAPSFTSNVTSAGVIYNNVAFGTNATLKPLMVFGNVTFSANSTHFCMKGVTGVCVKQ